LLGEEQAHCQTVRRSMTEQDARESETPADIDGRSWRVTLRRAVRAFGVDECPDAAAGLTFYAILALVPTIMVSFSIVSLLGRGDETAGVVLDVVGALALRSRMLGCPACCSS
jgi:membrane protein